MTTVPVGSVVADFIADAEANSGTITMASSGIGSASHLAGELFKLMAGINLVHVPYRGGAAMVIDLVGGQVQVGLDVMPISFGTFVATESEKWAKVVEFANIKPE